MTTSTQKQFIESVAKYVAKYAPQYGIKCYSAVIAQAICESGWGKSTLSAKYHNYFGLKCGTLWKGGSVSMKTGEEYLPGVHTTITDNFRTYPSMEEGIKGYFEFIQLERYHNLRGITDPKKYLQTIKADGYATSSSYVQTNMKLIEEHDLTDYDPAPAKEENKQVSKKTNAGLIAYAKAQLGLPYWWGTFGQIASASLYSAKKSQYPSYYTAGDFGSQFGKRVHDCVGLIKGYLWSSSPTAAPVYNSAQDVTAAGMYSASKKRGTIKTFDKVAGRLVFRGKSASAITHIGVYIGDGYVIEAKGHAYGVVKTKLSDGGWTHWSQCPWTAEEGAQADTGTSEQAPDKNASRGLPEALLTASKLVAKSDQTFLVSGTGEPNREPLWTARVTTASGDLNVRLGAGMNHPLCRTFGPIPRGADVGVCDAILDGSENTWYFVRYAGKFGFSSAKYLVKVG